ncbi:DUF1499 domain-containing protein [Halalkalibacter krulwichiae]|uniref:Cytosolic protein n=1 Tax=Halalkalibacter krulwichiae TaxID=199441 RepID=A0A1X9MFC4_9BACI|nr:DUF1499 domain-containing protein [Halalkalibacter krulwichiae]ARK31230.1 hypothetical protein BkAM31D_15965 [Halalkalibacter krulwichiae]
MTALRKIVGLWKNFEETSENPKLPGLKTRYYKKSREAMLESVKKIANNKLPQWKILKVDEERGEITMEKEGMSASVMVITVFKINPIRSAIDVYCAKKGSFGDLGSSYQSILTFFKALNTEVTPED